MKSLFVVIVVFGFQQYAESILFLPTNSAFGIIAAIAIPLELPHRNVFLSYNFEANYNYPHIWGIPPILNGIDDYRSCSNCTLEESPDDSTTSNENRSKRGLLTRSNFYKILTSKFERHELNGEKCLLRMICETNASSLDEINGVLGTLVHIIFSPSTSMSERLPLIYYQAEVDGHHNSCKQYEKECETSILDLISTPLHEIINSF